MKRLLPMLFSILMVSCAFGASEEDFIGEWINTDAQGLPRIIITRQNDAWKIHAWGRCTPEPCDWGETTLHLIGDSVGAKTFERGFAKWEKDYADTFLLIRFEGTGSDYFTKNIDGEKVQFRADVPQILVEVIQLFKDNSGRSNYRKVSLLHKRDAESSRQILVYHDASGNVIIKLIGEGKNGVWSLIDGRNDIEVKKLSDGLLKVKANIAFQPIGSSSVNTQIKPKPGKVIVLSGIIGGRTISLECPPN